MSSISFSLMYLWNEVSQMEHGMLSDGIGADVVAPSCMARVFDRSLVVREFTAMGVKEGGVDTYFHLPPLVLSFEISRPM
jgi:hypothetical protein